MTVEQERRSAKPRAFRFIQARPRLFGGLALGVVTGLLLPADWFAGTRILVAWNVGILAFIVSVFLMMLSVSEASMRQRAELHDEGKHLILALTAVAAAFSIAAILFQLGMVATLTGTIRLLHFSLTALTILTSWCFLHLTFALHYAHEYYDPRVSTEKPPAPALEFPGADPRPDYFDFVYFAFVIGVASSTADVNIVSRKLRRVVLVHGIISFFFNIAVLGLSINIASGLI
jgi:uncharacterized membrane protein